MSRIFFYDDQLSTATSTTKFSVPLCPSLPQCCCVSQTSISSLVQAAWVLYTPLSLPDSLSPRCLSPIAGLFLLP